LILHASPQFRPPDPSARPYRRQREQGAEQEETGVIRRSGPLLLIVAGAAGLAAYLLDSPALRDIYPAPVLGVLVALVVAVDAHRRMPAGSIVVALLVAVLLASSLGLLAFGSALAIVGVTLMIVGLIELVLDDDVDSGDAWAGIAALVPRRVTFTDAAAQIRSVTLTAVLTQATIDLSGLPGRLIEVRTACWGGTIDLVVPDGWVVLIASLTDHAVRFSGESDGIWDSAEERDPDGPPIIVLRTAGLSGSVFVRKQPIAAAALEER
jgi:hypothetical protein